MCISWVMSFAESESMEDGQVWEDKCFKNSICCVQFEMPVKHVGKDASHHMNWLLRRGTRLQI